jgi:hypothetical protein
MKSSVRFAATVPARKSRTSEGLALSRTVSAGARSRCGSSSARAAARGHHQGYAETAPKFAPVVGSQPQNDRHLEQSLPKPRADAVVIGFCSQFLICY